MWLELIGFVLRTDLKGVKFGPRLPDCLPEGQYKHLKHNALERFTYRHGILYSL
jgi:hypothetical protein